MIRIQIVIQVSFLMLLCYFSPVVVAQQDTKTGSRPELEKPKSAIDTKKLKEAVRESFRKTHDGWSSDEVILNDELYEAFIKNCSGQLPEVPRAEFGWTLLNLRKAGQLETKSTRRTKSNVAPVIHIAEIAARTTADRFRVSTDRIMVDAEMRAAFNSVATAVDPAADLYLVRKAAFKLRKARQLRPELITRIADWKRVVQTFPADKVAKQPGLIPDHPGIYIFRDKTGYLYIGQAENVRARLIEHLDQSHSQSLAKYLGQQGANNISIEVHSFDPESRAQELMVRRAYESELIASRKPRFNIQP